jgi:transposase
MPTERLCMRHTREILRHKWALVVSHRRTTETLGVSHGAITQTVQRAKRAGLDWAAVCALSDPELEAKLYPPPPRNDAPRPAPDWTHVDLELRRKGVTLELLHQEYLAQHPDGLRRSAFCARYRAWKKARGVVMRQHHLAGDKLFVDYSGDKVYYMDPGTGERIGCELFVATLGASSYTFAEATLSQKTPDFLGSQARALSFFGGVPAAVVSDQLKSGIIVPCRYEPGPHTAYLDFAGHYGTALVPARPRSPRDKAKVEVAVQVAQRWIVARLRNVVCTSLSELNAQIRRLLDELNARPMRAYGKSRRQLFDELDRPALRPLPETPYTYQEWKKARVNLDYHVELSRHYYSVPHALVHEVVELRYTSDTVEILHKGARVALHRRSLERGRYTTRTEHMPRGHQEHANRSPERLLLWARTVGPMTEALCEKIFQERPHPEQGYRSCLGLIRLAKRYGKARVEAACTRALWTGALSYRSVHNILASGLDGAPLYEESAGTAAPVASHEHLRGPDYYQ